MGIDKYGLTSRAVCGSNIIAFPVWTAFFFDIELDVSNRKKAAGKPLPDRHFLFRNS